MKAVTRASVLHWPKIFGNSPAAVSENLRGAFVVALSLCLAYGLAFWWQLEKPFWAGFSVIILAGLPTVGQSLQKGLLRAGGTLLGAGMALLLTATLHQHHMLLLLGLSLWLAATAYCMSGNPNARYFYFIAGLVCLIVVVMSVQAPLSAFNLAINRAQETLLGIGAHTFVSLLVMQPSSRSLLLHTLEHIRERHRRLAVDLSDTQALQELPALQERAALLLPAVELESPKDYSRRHAWMGMLALSRDLTALQREPAPRQAVSQQIASQQTDLLHELDTFALYLGHDGPAPHVPPIPAPPLPPISERLRAALQIFVQFWAVILVWVTCNPPGLPTMNFVEMAVLMGFICLFGKQPPTALFRPFLMGIAALLPLYFFVYPALHSAESFLAVMFIYAFLICALFPSPKQALSREGFFLPWLAVGQFANIPAYSPERFISFVMVLMLGIMLVTVVHQLCFAER